MTAQRADASCNRLLSAAPASEAQAERTRRIVIACCIGAAITFGNLYGIQALLPSIARDFSVSSAAASLIVSVTTAVLAFALLVAAPISERYGRTQLMTASVFATSALGFATAFAPTFPILVALRALSGITLAGMAAAAIAYLGEEVPQHRLGYAVGLYVAFSSLGGLAARLMMSFATDLFSWRAGLLALGLFSLTGAIAFQRLIPRSKEFTRTGISARSGYATHLRSRGDAAAVRRGFLLQGSFVALFNYMSFRLYGPPFNLSQTAIGAIFLVYLLGAFSSARMGRFADRAGIRKALLLGSGMLLAGVLVTLPNSIPIILVGVSVATAGFFGAHSVVSSAVNRLAPTAKSQASALYLLAYYIGGSVFGSGLGFFWDSAGWPGVVAGLATAAAIAFVLLAFTPQPP